MAAVAGEEGRASGRRTGRRPGNPDTRSAIIDAAGNVFATTGFNGATIRAIAAAADVDPALVHHYFGTKRELYLATIDMPVDPGQIITQVIAGGLDGLGHRLVAAITTAWESPAQPAMIAVLRSALTDPALARGAREFLATEVISRILRAAKVPAGESELRGAMAAAQIAGLILTRYLLRIPPIADVPRETVVRWVGPSVQRYITAPIDELEAAGPGGGPDGIDVCAVLLDAGPFAGAGRAATDPAGRRP